MLDADGLELLSMRHVARTLNTTAAALYWHVGSKDGLLDLIFDRVIGEQPVPDPDPERWEEQVRDVARTMRRRRSSATATSSGSRSAASRWVPTRCATPTGCWPSSARAGSPTRSRWPACSS